MSRKLAKYDMNTVRDQATSVNGTFRQPDYVGDWATSRLIAGMGKRRF
jgi:hypothetical protein